MTALSVVRDDHATPSTADVRQTLTELMRYGRPSLSMPSNGWHCCVKMNTNAQGATFDVRSDFDHADMGNAATECLERVRAAVAAIGNA